MKKLVFLGLLFLLGVNLVLGQQNSDLPGFGRESATSNYRVFVEIEDFNGEGPGNYNQCELLIRNEKVEEANYQISANYDADSDSLQINISIDTIKGLYDKEIFSGSGSNHDPCPPDTANGVSISIVDKDELVIVDKPKETGEVSKEFEYAFETYKSFTLTFTIHYYKKETINSTPNKLCDDKSLKIKSNLSTLDDFIYEVKKVNDESSDWQEIATTESNEYMIDNYEALGLGAIDKPSQEIAFRISHSGFPDAFRDDFPTGIVTYYKSPEKPNVIKGLEPTCHGGNDGRIQIEYDNKMERDFKFTIKFLVENNNGNSGHNASISGNQKKYTIDTSHIIQDTVDTDQDKKPTLPSGPINKIIIENNANNGCFHTIHNNENYDLNIPQADKISVKTLESGYSYTYDENEYNIKRYGEEGLISANISGGNSPYNFELISGSDTSTYSSINDTSFTVDTLAGSYTLNVTDNDGCVVDTFCTGTKSIELKQPDALELQNEEISSRAETCHPDDRGSHEDGNIEVDTIFGGIGPYMLYLIKDGEMIDSTTVDDGNFSGTIDNLETGNYSLHVKDTFNVRDTLDEININGPEESLSFSVKKITPPKCLGGNTGEIVLTDLKGGNADTYSDYDITHKIVNEGNYEESIRNDTIITGLEDEEDYKIKMQDSENCYQIFDTTVKENPNPVQLEVLEAIDPTCHDFNDGKIRVTASKGDTTEEESYHFSLLPFNDSEVSGQTATIKNLKGTPDKYYVYVEDTNRCITGTSAGVVNGQYITHPVDTSRYVDTVTLEHPDTLKLAFQEKMGASFAGAADGKVKFSISGGNRKYAYWIIDKFGTKENGKDTLTHDMVRDTGSIQLDGLASGDYRIHVKDTCGCTNGGNFFESSFIIRKPEKPLELVLESKSPVSCHNMHDGVVELKAIGGWHKANDYKFRKDTGEWNSGNNFYQLSPGDYTFWVKDERGVKESLDVSVPEPDSLQVRVDSVINVRCFEEANGRVMLNCDGGWKPYEYSLNGEATWEPLPASQIVGDLGPGSYQIAVRASNGQCVDTASFVITEPAKLDTAGMTIQQATCGEANGAVSVTAVGGSQPYTYKWFSNDNLVTTGAKADSLASGIYGLQIEDQHGCVKRVNTIGVENTRAPVLSEVDAGVVTCSGYEDGSITFSVEEGIPPFTITCYSKSGEVADQLSAGETGDFTCDSLASGSYTIEVTDAMDCHTYQTVTIGSKAALQLNTYKTRPTCHGYNDGSIRLSAAGANGGYQYNWSDGYTGYLRDRLSADSFKVSVVDSLGCSRDFSFYLDQPEKVSVDLGEDAIICGGMEYSLHPEGYNTYYWQQDGEVIAQTPSVSLDEAGTYTLEVTDEKGCAGRDTFNLEVDNDLLRADFIIPTEAQAGDTLAGIDISNPEPDSVYWHFEGSPTVFDWEASESNPYTRFIRYSDTGRFDVALFSMKAQCRDSVVKTVHILPDSENQDDKKLLGAKPDLIETFHVFPNPNNGEFSVRVELTKKADITLDMISSQRNQLIDRKILSGLKNYKLQYSFAGLTPGVYILNLQVRDKQRAIQVIIT